MKIIEKYEIFKENLDAYREAKHKKHEAQSKITVTNSAGQKVEQIGCINNNIYDTGADRSLYSGDDVLHWYSVEYCPNYCDSKICKNDSCKFHQDNVKFIIASKQVKQLKQQTIKSFLCIFIPTK